MGQELFHLLVLQVYKDISSVQLVLQLGVYSLLHHYVFEKVKSWYPVGRVGRPEDIAAAVAFLSADEAGFVNGASLAVDGGLTAGSFKMIKDMIGK